TSLVLVLAACGSTAPQTTVPPPPPQHDLPPEPVVVKPPSDDAKIAEAKQFAADADKELRRVLVAAAEAEWTQETDETDAHQAAAAKANGEQAVAITRLMKQARTYEDVLPKPDASTKRQLQALIH